MLYTTKACLPKSSENHPIHFIERNLNIDSGFKAWAQNVFDMLYLSRYAFSQLLCKNAIVGFSCFIPTALVSTVLPKRNITLTQLLMAKNSIKRWHGTCLNGKSSSPDWRLEDSQLKWVPCPLLVSFVVHNCPSATLHLGCTISLLNNIVTF